MNITDYYNSNIGNSIISEIGLQKHTEDLDSFSEIFSSIVTSKTNGKCSIDSAWESMDIYYVNYNIGYVKKIRYNDQVELASLFLGNPVCISVIQYANQMQTNITYPKQQPRGCWIADKGTKEIIKTDNNLNIILRIGDFSDPEYILSDLNGGCYVADLATENIIQIAPDGQVIAVKKYSLFNPAISSVNEMKLNASGDLYVLADDRVYKFSSIVGELVQEDVIYPLSHSVDFESSSSSSTDISPEEENHVGSIDIDRNSGDQLLYVTGGNSFASFIQVYDDSGSLVNNNEYLNISFPYIIRVIQGLNSTSLYILEDTSKWDQFGYGSSSSSSSSSSLEHSSSSSSLQYSSSSSLQYSSSSSSEEYSSSSSSSLND